MMSALPMQRRTTYNIATLAFKALHADISPVHLHIYYNFEVSILFSITLPCRRRDLMQVCIACVIPQMPRFATVGLTYTYIR